MLIIKKGNLLEAKENIICHQVNENGVMGGGIAKQIADKYPNVEKEYKHIVEIEEDVIGMFHWVNIENDKYIANLFTQKEYETQYNKVKELFNHTKTLAKERNYSIATCYNYGCGIANGDWREVEKILIDIFDDYDITIYKYEV